jgi:hypothetical protein
MNTKTTILLTLALGLSGTALAEQKMFAGGISCDTELEECAGYVENLQAEMMQGHWLGTSLVVPPGVACDSQLEECAGYTDSIEEIRAAQSF